MRALSRYLVAAAVGLLLAVVAAEGAPTRAADVTVNETADELNSDGDCSLREAIEAANLGAPVDGCAAAAGGTIMLPAGTYTLSRTGAGEDVNQTGDLDVLAPVSIEGAGADATTIDGGAIDRVIELYPEVAIGEVTISGVTIRNGHVEAPDDGAGLHVDAGFLTLADSSITMNDSGSGGGGVSVGTGASVTLENVSVSENVAATGGGIFVNGSVSLSDSEVVGNGAADEGGGIATDDGTVTLLNTEVRENTAGGDGGGIHHNIPFLEIAQVGSDGEPDLTITNSILTANAAADDGGGIFNNGHAAISGSTVSDNASMASGSMVGGGGGIANFDEMTISNSTISGNSAAINGGGIWNLEFSTLRMTNSTISGNEAAGTGGGIAQQTSGLFTGAVTLEHVTITQNEAPSAGGISNTTTVGSGSTFRLHSSIVAGNGTADCGGNNPFTSDGFNIAGDNTCNLASTGDQTNTDPMLGPLADNGGPTQTHALLGGSPAIDAADPGCPPPDTDQRGIARSQGPHCDAGAFELPAGRSPTPTPPPGEQRLWGDDDCDGRVNSVDALKDLRFVAALSVSQTEPCPDIGVAVTVTASSPAERVWGDVDCSGGSPNSVDALKLLRHVAGLPVMQTEPCPDMATQVLVSQ